MLAGSSTPPTFAVSGLLPGDVGNVTVTYTVKDQSGNVITLGPKTPPAEYLITASLSGPAAGNYLATTGTLFVVTIGADTDASGGRQVSFWDNKGNLAYITSTSILQSLDNLNLVTQSGAAFDPGLLFGLATSSELSADAAALDTWLQKANAQNAAYWLSAQLAAADLNVVSGNVKAGDMLYAGNLLPYRAAINAALAGLTSGHFGFGQTGSDLTSDGFISVEDLMAVANAALGQYSVAVGGDSFRAYMLALAQSLQGVNSNNAFAQLSPALLAEVFASYALDELS